MMSRCFGCYFHEGGYMFNRCDFFEMEYYCEPEDCEAFSTEDIPADEAKKLYVKIVYGDEEDD